MHCNIVVSCPSDMVGDREKLQNAVAIVNEQNAHFRQMHFDIKYWQKDVLFGVGDPQLIINNSIIKNADMVITLFGSRLGTPTARATSGTIEEIEEMIKAGKQVFVCFSEKDISITASDSEEKLRDILKVRELQKNYKGLYITYRTDEELEEKITNQLRLFVGSIEEDTIMQMWEQSIFMIEASTILKLWRNATGVRCHRNMMISALGFTMIILFSYLSQSKVLI